MIPNILFWTGVSVLAIQAIGGWGLGRKAQKGKVELTLAFLLAAGVAKYLGY